MPSGNSWNSKAPEHYKLRRQLMTSRKRGEEDRDRCAASASQTSIAMLLKAAGAKSRISIFASCDRRIGNQEPSGVVILRWPIKSLDPDFVLFGPVIVDPQNHLATGHTNNTGEFTAVWECMHWLLTEAPDGGILPVAIRYDSEYAARVAQRHWHPQTNLQLAGEVQKLISAVMERRAVHS